MNYVYPCLLHPDEGGFRVSFPDVKGANTSGATREDALEMAGDALAERLGLGVHEIRELLDPDSGSHADVVEQALRALGVRRTAARSSV